MKVIQPRTGFNLEQTCTGRGNGNKGCGAVILLDDRNDLRYFSARESTFFIHPEAVCWRCPECGTLNDVDKEYWPVDFKKLKPFSTYWKNTGQEDPTDGY